MLVVTHVVMSAQKHLIRLHTTGLTCAGITEAGLHHLVCYLCAQCARITEAGLYHLVCYLCAHNA